MMTDQVATAAAPAMSPHCAPDTRRSPRGMSPSARAAGPDVKWIETSGGPFAGNFVGPEDVAAGVFARIAVEWSEFHVEPDEYVASGDTVAVLGTYRGTYRATGKAVSARFVHMYRFRDGRVIRYECVGDTAMLNSALA